jgi:hypothetical protein
MVKGILPLITQFEWKLSYHNRHDFDIKYLLSQNRVKPTSNFVHQKTGIEI